MLTSVGSESIFISDGERTVFVPKNIEDAIRFLSEHPDARLVAGATDIGVQYNHGRQIRPTLLCLSDLHDLTKIEIGKEDVVIGAGATWSDVLESTGDLYAEFTDVLQRFGSPQIRNIGTVGGNLANASPIADSIPFLYAAGAELELLGARGVRIVPIEDFYQGYKQLDLQPGELIRAVRVPRLCGNETLKLYKVSRRRDMDISTFTAAILMTLENNQVACARIAFGGVGPIVVRAKQTEAFLEGREFNEALMRQAGSVARSEITPISDVRGSTDYRFQLAENVLMKFFHGAIGEPKTVTT